MNDVEALVTNMRTVILEWAETQNSQCVVPDIAQAILETLENFPFVGSVVEQEFYKRHRAEILGEGFSMAAFNAYSGTISQGGVWSLLGLTQLYQSTPLKLEKSGKRGFLFFFAHSAVFPHFVKKLNWLECFIVGTWFRSIATVRDFLEGRIHEQSTRKTA